MPQSPETKVNNDEKNKDTFITKSIHYLDIYYLSHLSNNYFTAYCNLLLLRFHSSLHNCDFVCFLPGSIRN